MLGVVELAGAAATFMGVKAAGKMAETIGTEVGNRMIKLYDTVKAKLTGLAAKEALADFEAKPDDARRKGALEVQLEKAIEGDAAFGRTLAALVEEIKAKGGDAIVQTANVTGDRNVTTQIVGSGNVVP
jgi:hypothetical protein